jgi:hypothetical protein
MYDIEHEGQIDMVCPVLNVLPNTGQIALKSQSKPRMDERRPGLS